MSEKEYYTVQEVALIAGMTKQAIYKRLNTSLQPFTKIVDGKKHLHKDVFQKLGVNQSTSKASEKVNINDNVAETIASLNRMIDLLGDQLAAKDKQLAEKDKQLDQVNATLNQAIKNQGMAHYNEAVKQIEAPKIPWYKKFKKNP